MAKIEKVFSVNFIMTMEWNDETGRIDAVVKTENGGVFARDVADTLDKQVRDALTELGWIAPDSEDKHFLEAIKAGAIGQGSMIYNGRMHKIVEVNNDK